MNDPSPQTPDTPPLGDLAEGRGMQVGGNGRTRSFDQDPRYREALTRECNTPTGATCVKFRAAPPQRGRFDFAEAGRTPAFDEARRPSPGCQAIRAALRSA